MWPLLGEQYTAVGATSVRPARVPTVPADQRYEKRHLTSRLRKLSSEPGITTVAKAYQVTPRQGGQQCFWVSPALLASCRRQGRRRSLLPPVCTVPASIRVFAVLQQAPT